MNDHSGACVRIIETWIARDSLDPGVVERNVCVLCVTVQREEVAVVEVVPPKVILRSMQALK